MPAGKGFLRIAIEDFIETFDLGKQMHKWWTYVLEKFEDEALDLYDDMLKKFPYAKYLPELFQPAFLRSALKRRPVQIVPILIAIVVMLVGVVIGMLVPIQRLGTYKLDELLHSNRPQVGDLMSMLVRDFIDDATAKKIFAELGFDEKIYDAYSKIARQYPTSFEYIAAWRRGLLSEEGLHLQLDKLGFHRDDKQLLKNITELIPPVTDLIRMAVREAFTPEVVERFNYAEAFPEEILEHTKKQGLPDDWVKRYWYAHWELPSPLMGYEMLHRLRPGISPVPFTTSDLDLLLRTADYAPFFRDKMIAISYSPFTRVDIRRMYKVGVLDRDAVKQSYMDIGYDDEHAEKLAEFTVRYEAEEESGLGLAAVKAAYKRGTITREEAAQFLAQSGYAGETGEFHLDLIDFDLASEGVELQLSVIRKAYVEGEIDELTMTARLGKLNLPSQRVTALLELWNIERDNKIQIPTKGELESMYRDAIINRDEHIAFLRKRGYERAVIDLYIKQLDMEIAQDAADEAEKSQDEAEKIAKSKAATDYQKKKSNLDLSIAQIKAEIADIAVALHSITDPDLIMSLATRAAELKAAIAQIEIAKAQNQVDLVKIVAAIRG